MRRRPCAADEAAARARILQGTELQARRLVIDGIRTAADRSDCAEPPAVVAHSLLGSAKFGVRGRCRAEVPTTLLWGRHDRLVPTPRTSSNPTRSGADC